MTNHEWPAQDYAIGSYIQASVADRFLANLILNPTESVLDVGCGNGAYTRKILDKVPQGRVLGMDSSQNMLVLAEAVIKDYPNFSLKQDNVLCMNYINQFDCVVSFWCLQWATDIKLAFTNIIKALKPGGKIFTLFPAGDDPYIMGYYALKKMSQFPFLKDFKPPMNYQRLENLADKLAGLPCKNINVAKPNASITLPSLDVFRKFVNGIAFYQGQLSEVQVKQVNEALVAWYEKECQKHWQGEHRFNFTLYLVTGEK